MNKLTQSKQSKTIREVLEDLAKEQYDDGWCASNVDKPHDGPDYDAIDQALKEISEQTQSDHDKTYADGFKMGKFEAKQEFLELIDEAKPDFIKENEYSGDIMNLACDVYQCKIKELIK